jgi:hypothetical protein
MSWLYEGNIVTEEHVPVGAVGFVYKIIHIPTGRYYIGKKSLTSTRRLAPLKGQKRKRTVTKSSDWEKYYSSNDWIKEQIKEGNAEQFSREIIQYCFSKKSLTYYEIYWQFHYNVLADDNAINENLMGKFYRKDLL